MEWKLKYDTDSLDLFHVEIDVKNRHVHCYDLKYRVRAAVMQKPSTAQLFNQFMLSSNSFSNLYLRTSKEEKSRHMSEGAAVESKSRARHDIECAAGGVSSTLVSRRLKYVKQHHD